MQSIKRLEDIQVPMAMIKSIAKINEYRGRQELYRDRLPEVFKVLHETATVQSITSSNRIEGIQVSERQLKELFHQNSTPVTRSEAEIAGYRDVLATIHASADHIPIKPQTILQLHRDLCKYLPGEGGRWKAADNVIEEKLPDGSRRVRFVPVQAFLIPQYMEDLCAHFNTCRNRGQADDLLLVFSFVLDFLCIHPFTDGNGRMSRLLTQLLLYQAGIHIGRYVAIERIIEASKESYYAALEKSSQGWHQGTHDPIPWLSYSLGTLLAAYKELEERVNLVENRRDSKNAEVRAIILRFGGDFTVRDLDRACPHISRQTINRVLAAMKSEGLVACVVVGRHAKWRNLR